MTSQRLVEDFARWLWERDPGSHIDELLPAQRARIPDSYMNEAAVFLAGELGQRLQRGGNKQKQREAIVNYLVEHGLDPSYMSYEQVAASAVEALDNPS